MILDMNWHRFGDWGGYSWNRNLLPFPEEMIERLTGRDRKEDRNNKHMNDESLRLGTNFHDADGVKEGANDEAIYSGFFKAVEESGMFPDLKPHADIPFTPANAT
jgi:hypothetical protein